MSLSELRKSPTKGYNLWLVLLHQRCQTLVMSRAVMEVGDGKKADGHAARAAGVLVKVSWVGHFQAKHKSEMTPVEGLKARPTSWPAASLKTKTDPADPVFKLESHSPSVRCFKGTFRI